MLGNVTGKLGHLDFGLELPLEAREEDFSLSWLEPVTQRWDRPEAIRDGEEDEAHEVDE